MVSPYGTGSTLESKWLRVRNSIFRCSAAVVASCSQLRASLVQAGAAGKDARAMMGQTPLHDSTHNSLTAIPAPWFRMTHRMRVPKSVYSVTQLRMHERPRGLAHTCKRPRAFGAAACSGRGNLRGGGTLSSASHLWPRLAAPEGLAAPEPKAAITNDWVDVTSNIRGRRRWHYFNVKASKLRIRLAFGTDAIANPRWRLPSTP